MLLLRKWARKKSKNPTEFGNFDLTISFLAELPETLPFTGCKSEKIRSYFGCSRAQKLQILKSNFAHKVLESINDPAFFIIRFLDSGIVWKGIQFLRFEYKINKKKVAPAAIRLWMKIRSKLWEILCLNGKSAFSEPLLIATDDPLVFITAFKGALTVAGTERIVDQLSEGAALLIGLKILADHLESF